jgi:hypothetical protein
MGTSASGGGASGGNPLIPSWINQSGLPPLSPNPLPPPERDQQDPDKKDKNDKGKEDTPDSNQNGQPIPLGTVGGVDLSIRFRAPRTDFNKYIKSGGSKGSSLRKALKSYSRNAAGGTQRMARRMQVSTSRVAAFYGVVDEFKKKGAAVTLRQFSLESYEGKPVLEILSALSDVIFKDSGKIFDDTQDDSITKQAYCDTVVKITELDGIDLDNLTNDQVEVMMAIFIEETIAHRIINDIGDGLSEKNPDIKELVALEENIYQLVSGLVRNHIMPEIIATNRGDQSSIEQKIENIYRQAFDALAGLTN